jgi:hypothetical protein
MGACIFGISLVKVGGLDGIPDLFSWYRFRFYSPPFRHEAKCKFEIIIYAIYFAMCGAVLILLC